MWGSMRSDRFPRLFNYEQALRKESEIVPYSKGKYKGNKPLAERRRSGLTIRKVGDDVIVRLYSTDIIKYRPDGEIIVNQGGWSTSTTHEVIARILGTTIYQRHYDNWIACKDGTFILRKKGDNIFKRSSPYGSLEYQNPEYPAVTKLKRREYNDTRKKYKKFETYLFGTLRLRGHEPPSEEEALSAFNGQYEPMMLDGLMELINCEESWYQASLVILRRCSPMGWLADKTIKEARVRREMKDIICTHHRDELFYAELVTTGRVVRDHNAKYFSGRVMF